MKGCLIGAAVIVLGFFGLALIGSMLPEPDPAVIKQRQDEENARAAQAAAARQKADAERHEANQRAAAEAAKAEQASKEAALKKAQDVPGNVEELAKEILKEGYQESSAMPDGKGGWFININGFDPNGSPGILRQRILDLAARCHPQGMKVSDFSVAFQTTFTDGLGNEFKGGLVRVRLRQDVASRINWTNKDLIDFKAAFETEFVHRSFKAKWEADQ